MTAAPLALAFRRGRPARLARPLDAPLLEPRELLELVVEVGAAHRRGDGRAPARILVEPDLQVAGAGAVDYLPAPGDASLEAYTERVSGLVGGRRFGLAINLCHLHHWSLWLRLREIVRELAPDGPRLYAHPVLFLGNYDRTPFGIHRDEVSTFMFVLSGRKRLHVWEPRAFRDDADERLTAAGAARRPAPTVLEAGVGEAIFWPVGYWHVGESVGGLSVSVNLGLAPWPAGHEIADGLQRSLADASATRGTRRASAGRAPAARPVAARAVRRLARHVASGAFERDVVAASLRRRTADGFREVPAPRPSTALAADDLVRGDRCHPIRWARLPDDDVVVSAHGHSRVLPAHPRLLALIERLNGGKPARVGDLVAEFAGAVRRRGVRFIASEAAIREVLATLHAWRAIS